MNGRRRSQSIDLPRKQVVNRKRSKSLGTALDVELGWLDSFRSSIRNLFGNKWILPGDTLDKYKITRKIGSGAFSTVYLATDETMKVALKMIKKKQRKDANVLERAHNEAALLKKLQHQNIVRYVDEFETESDMVIVLEYVDGLELFELVAKQRMSNDLAIHVAKQLLDVLCYLKAEGIVHADLKLENVILRPDNVVKLIDFGLSFKPPSNLDIRNGSDEYLAPEIILNTQTDSFSADVWAFGVIFYALINGKLPFSYQTTFGRKKMFHRICLGECEPSFEYEELIRRILEPVVERRLKIEEIKL